MTKCEFHSDIDWTCSSTMLLSWKSKLLTDSNRFTKPNC